MAESIPWKFNLCTGGGFCLGGSFSTLVEDVSLGTSSPLCRGGYSSLGPLFRFMAGDSSLGLSLCLRGWILLRYTVSALEGDTFPRFLYLSLEGVLSNLSTIGIWVQQCMRVPVPYTHKHLLYSQSVISATLVSMQ